MTLSIDAKMYFQRLFLLLAAPFVSTPTGGTLPLHTGMDTCHPIQAIFLPGLEHFEFSFHLLPDESATLNLVPLIVPIPLSAHVTFSLYSTTTGPEVIVFTKSVRDGVVINAQIDGADPIGTFYRLTATCHGTILPCMASAQICYAQTSATSTTAPSTALTTAPSTAETTDTTIAETTNPSTSGTTDTTIAETTNPSTSETTDTMTPSIFD